MKTLVIFCTLCIGFVAHAQYNFSITNEELEAHEIVVLPYNEEGKVIYDEIFENIEGASKDQLIHAFRNWFVEFYNNNREVQFIEDKDGKIQLNFRYMFSFWNGASLKQITAKAELRFYAKDGRARIVLTNICYNLYNEADIATPRFIKGIRNITRAVDVVESGDPLFPYTMEGLDEEDSSMKKRWVKAGDLVILKIIASLEEALYNFEDQEEEDKW